MLVVVGSKNPVKVKATANVFGRFYFSVEVVGLGVKTAVPPQPIGLEATISGAVERAKEAMKLRWGSEYAVGIEAGLVPVPMTMTGYMDQQFAAIVDRMGVVTVGGGSSFEYPRVILSSVLRKGVEVGSAMEDLTGIRGLGKRQGAIGFLSHGALDRTGLTEQAVLMALVPRLSWEFYAEDRQRDAARRSRIRRRS